MHDSAEKSNPSPRRYCSMALKANWLAQASHLRYAANKKEMHVLGEKNEFGKEKPFNYKRPGDHWKYEEKSYFRTMKRKSIYNVPEVTHNKALKRI